MKTGSRIVKDRLPRMIVTAGLIVSFGVVALGTLIKKSKMIRRRLQKQKDQTSCKS